MSFKLIVISPPKTHRNEISILCNLFENGLQILHVRKHGLSRQELRNYIDKIPSKFHKRLVIHSHYSLLKEFNLKGIHLTERTRIKSIPSWFDPKKHTLSASFHSINSLERIQRKYDYVFLSPIFNSISKKKYKGAFTEADLKILLKKQRNVIALGGIEPGVLKKIQELKFAGAAALGFIWENKSPLGADLKLISKIK